MRTDLFDYHLPPELIAQTPGPRGAARLLVLHRRTGEIEHRCVADLPLYLSSGDVIVLNDTRVSARRLEARRDNGLAAEVLLIRRIDSVRWEALVRPGKALRMGRTLQLIAPTSDQPCITAQVVGITHEGGRILEIADEAAAADLATWGATPLPPYIHTALPPSQEARYQTVYARHDGSAAAPTAGLHVTPEMLEQLTARGVGRADLTLHIGIDTFRPVRADDIEAHSMHGEFITVSAQTAATIERAPGRVVAIGTTSVRALESAAQHATEGSRIAAYHGETRLFISPGYRFRIVDAILTNFHLPKSTLLMLISAFAGRDAVMNAYGQAIQHGYRFFSFGDAMLIV